MAEETFSCDRCGRDWPKRQLKEVFYEEGDDKKRVRQEMCPKCLDEVMNEAAKVRGVGGEEKRTAAHVTPGPGPAERESIGERRS